MRHAYIMISDSFIEVAIDKRDQSGPSVNQPLHSLPAAPSMGVFAKLVDLMVGRVPMGYEDETGFHYGEDPRNGFRPTSSCLRADN